MKQIILFLSLALTFASCSNDNDDGSNIAFTTIYQRDNYGASPGTIPKSNLVITNQTDWNTLLEKLNIITQALYTTPDTNVDFSKYQVIAVFDEVRNSGGYSIDITKITQSNNEITVKVEQLKKGNLTSVITQPFHIVKIAKSNKTVVFK
ncbi:protease complex subunit PrcB family protein [Flavobacterium sp. LC2016-01]|uniref:protease complex subunit PrcB family protein n=1 Tax=Flavobacterium sp. LC2016-01 TaxID=2675876 RepID=UPI0012BAD4BA|nr:protease complex subunit PrcB family protein [Flavobacterium sp. LC2016-01]MTH18001.1 protease complex subunit PrcB family protein [Flavobacterium sp. LC2016-01]